MEHHCAVGEPAQGAQAGDPEQMKAAVE